MATVNIDNEPLGTEKDKVGIPVEIFYCSTIGGTDNLTYFLKNFVKLLESGYTHPHIPGGNRSKAIYAVINGKIVGQLTFELMDDFSKTTWIILTTVDEEYRNRGIYSMLHKYLYKIMYKLGSRKVASHVHIDNKEIQASQRKMGFKQVYIRSEKEL
jgi:GNAT superfamily N-acetyltransferase